MDLQPLKQTAGGYWQESRQPLASLAFVLPLLVVYEVGLLTLGTAAVRNGADAWLRGLLDMLGFGGYFLLPVLIVGVLLAWHHTTGMPWRVRPALLYWMLLESAALGVVLVLLAHLQGRILFSIGGDVASFFGRLAGYFGAGIYEEALFRLMLLPVVAAIVGWWMKNPWKQAAMAIVITSLAFSAAHYVGPYGDNFTAYTFVFRFLAGGFFAVLFVTRGFGIAAGTHALYDVFVGLF